MQNQQDLAPQLRGLSAEVGIDLWAPFSRGVSSASQKAIKTL
jgi:hypothetical protein